jgi:hypothetical protein
MKYLPIFIIVVFAAINGCENPVELNRPGDKLSGYITHIDTNLYLNGGFYSVSVYNADSTSPFQRVPVRTDSMTLTRRDALYESTYDMDGIAAGRYYVAATWSRYPRVANEIPIVLGTYGCDTSITCTAHKIIVYPNFDGNFRNITSWTDLNKRLN